MAAANGRISCRSYPALSALIIPMVTLSALLSPAPTPEIRPPKVVSIEERIASLYVDVNPKPRVIRKQRPVTPSARTIGRRLESARRPVSRRECLRREFWRLNLPAPGSAVNSNHPHRQLLDPVIAEYLRVYPTTFGARLRRVDSAETRQVFPNISLYRLQLDYSFGNAIGEATFALVVNQQDQIQLVEKIRYRVDGSSHLSLLLQQHAIKINSVEDAKTVLAAYCDFQCHAARAARCQQCDAHTWHLPSSVHSDRKVMLEAKLGHDNEILFVGWTNSHRRDTDYQEYYLSNVRFHAARLEDELKSLAEQVPSQRVHYAASLEKAKSISTESTQTSFIQLAGWKPPPLVRKRSW